MRRCEGTTVRRGGGCPIIELAAGPLGSRRMNTRSPCRCSSTSRASPSAPERARGEDDVVTLRELDGDALGEAIPPVFFDGTRDDHSLLFPRIVSILSGRVHPSRA